MPYKIQHSGVGPWLYGAEVPDAEFERHPFHEKFLHNGGAVKISESESRDLDPQAKDKKLAELNAELGRITAERDALLGINTEPHAPAKVSVEINADDQPGMAEADANRAAGIEVVQPTGGEPNVGTIVPGEAADTDNETPAQARMRHAREAKRNASESR